MVVDVPEGLHVPTISAPPAPILTWNEFGESWLVPVFDFASAYLHDRGALLLMYPSSSSHRGQLLGWYAECGFKVSQSWLGMNRLHLTSSLNPSLRVIFCTLSVINIFEVTFAWNSYAHYFADYAVLHLTCGEREGATFSVPNCAFS